jgi:hypothetical protein
MDLFGFCREELMLVRYQRKLADLEAYYDIYCDSAITKKAIARYRNRMSLAIGMVVFGGGLILSPTAPLLPLVAGDFPTMLVEIGRRYQASHHPALAAE